MGYYKQLSIELDKEKLEQNYIEAATDSIERNDDVFFSLTVAINHINFLWQMIEDFSGLKTVTRQQCQKTLQIINQPLKNRRG